MDQAGMGEAFCSEIYEHGTLVQRKVPQIPVFIDPSMELLHI